MLHHVAIPLEEKDVDYRYRVRSGDQVSPTCTFKGYPSNTHELRWRWSGIEDTQYADDFAECIKSVGGNMLLWFRQGENPVLEMKSLDGTVLNSVVISSRPGAVTTTLSPPVVAIDPYYVAFGYARCGRKPAHLYCQIRFTDG